MQEHIRKERYTAKVLFSVASLSYLNIQRYRQYRQ